MAEARPIAINVRTPDGALHAVSVSAADCASADTLATALAAAIEERMLLPASLQRLVGAAGAPLAVPVVGAVRLVPLIPLDGPVTPASEFAKAGNFRLAEQCIREMDAVSNEQCEEVLRRPGVNWRSFCTHAHCGAFAGLTLLMVEKKAVLSLASVLDAYFMKILDAIADGVIEAGAVAEENMARRAFVNYLSITGGRPFNEERMRRALGRWGSVTDALRGTIVLQNAIDARASMDFIRWLVANGGLINASMGQPVATAARVGYAEALEVLVAADKSRDTLSRALNLATANGHLECVRVLLRLGADPAADNHSAMQKAREARHGEIARVLRKACGCARCRAQA